MRACRGATLLSRIEQVLLPDDPHVAHSIFATRTSTSISILINRATMFIPWLRKLTFSCTVLGEDRGENTRPHKPSKWNTTMCQGLESNGACKGADAMQDASATYDYGSPPSFADSTKPYVHCQVKIHPDKVLFSSRMPLTTVIVTPKWFPTRILFKTRISQPHRLIAPYQSPTNPSIQNPLISVSSI